MEAAVGISQKFPRLAQNMGLPRMLRIIGLDMIKVCRSIALMIKGLLTENLDGR